MCAGSIDVALPSAEHVEALVGGEHDSMLWGLEQMRRRVEAAIAGVVEHAARTGHHLSDGHRSVGAWAMAVSNCSPGEARRRARSGRLMRQWSDLADEMGAGRVGVAQLDELARLGANPRCGERLATSGSVLIEAAKTLQFVDFRVVARRWEQLADVDGAHRGHELSLERRNVSIVEVGGEFEIRGRLPAIHGTIARDVLSRFAEVEFHADADAARAEHGSASAERLGRTAAQRRADALIKIFETAATAGVEAKPVEVCVNVIINEDQFSQYLRNQIDDTPVVIDPATVLDQRCETSDGVAVDPRQAVALALIGHVRRIVFDSAGVVVNAGRRTRLYRGAIRQILRSLEPRCIWLGCLIRAAVSDLDHLHGYADGGSTDAANSAITCRHHNLFKYRNGYHARRDPQGTWRLHRPDGTTIQPPDAA